MSKLLAAAFTLALLTLCVAASDGLAQGRGGRGGGRGGQGAQQSPGATTAVYPPLFLREDWKFDKSVPNVNDEREPEHPIAPTDVATANLEVRLYGDKAGTRTVIQPYNKDITYVMSLLTTSNWLVTLRDKTNDVDLTGLSMWTWRTRVSGFHLLRPVLKLADGTWLVGDYGEGAHSANSTLFLESEVAIANVRWLPLDITRIVTRGQSWVEKPDLSKVDEVGFADLLPGSGHGWGGFVNVSRIEVYGRAVSR